jgi:16S rRNA (adenine1518-N6/adenine1519-N6)-dimethyltransferase
MQQAKKPRLGQNFLIDTQAQRRIVEALGPAVRGTVVEIGPGKAAITQLLVGLAKKLYAIELDPTLAAALRTRFPAERLASVATPEARLDVIQADVLTVNLSALAVGEGRSLAVIGNLPYYITSPILQHLFRHESSISRAVLMVQREVAERITAKPGSREYGLLSVLCQLHAQSELLFTLAPEAFSPPPDVHSAVVRFEFAPLWQEMGLEPVEFTRFLTQCFAQKRKTLRNNLLAAGYSVEPVMEAVRLADADASVRAEALGVKELAAIYKGLRNNLA